MGLFLLWQWQFELGSLEHSEESLVLGIDYVG
jgi:hypothetical protein